MKIFTTLVFYLALALPIQAATLHVDGITCTLAEAIVAANTDIATGGCPRGESGPDTLVLDADLTLTAADPTSTVHGGVRAALPDVTDDLTIAAGLGNVIRRDPAFTCEAATADPIFRFLQLESGSLTLRGLGFENGCFVGSEVNNLGGGIRAAASTELTLDDVTVSAHGAFASSGSLSGGFLYTEGDQLTLIDVDFTDMVAEASISLLGGVLHIDDPVTAILESTEFSRLNVAGSVSLQGGAVYSRSQVAIDGAHFEEIDWVGDSVQGGAIYSSSRFLSLTNTSFLLFTGIGGVSAQGGAVYANNSGLELSDSIFFDLDIFASGSCTGGALFSSETGPHERLIFERVRCQAGGAVNGAAARFLASDTILRDCLFRDNQGRTVQTGVGGAVSASRFELLERCAFIENRIELSSSMVNSEVRGGGVAANEIGVSRNVTFAGNIAQAGQSAGVDAASAFGGGLYLSNTTSRSMISAATFVGNQAIGGAADPGFLDGEGFGGGLYVATGHTAAVMGSILSSNTVIDGAGSAADQECFADGGLNSLGLNLAHSPDASCDFSAFGDIVGIDPNLHPVDDYGCATPLPDGSCVPTAAIDQTSWAIDWSSCADLGIGDDSRGLQRRQDIAGVPNLTADACDAGAFEARDSDGDGATDMPDLCPMDADPDQSDGDGDGVGDVCDACAGDDSAGDGDGDRVCDDLDVCPGADDSADGDGDRVPDGCDLCLGNDTTGDGDGDLVCDDLDLCAGFDDGADADGDTVPDGCDLCLGADASGDTDGDGLCNDRDAALGDRVWLDDGNGLQDGGEPGIAGITVRLFSAAGALLDTTSTDADGSYSFSPGPGEYYVEFVLPEDMAYAPRDQGGSDEVDSDVNASSGTTSPISLAAGWNEAGLDAGLEPAVIGNRVWLDADGDGLQQVGEAGLAGVTVRLLDQDDAVIASSTTGADGIYGFLGLATGDYRIEVVAPAGHAFSRADMGGDDLVDSDVDPVTGRGPLFAYRAASASQSWDAGLVVSRALFASGFESGGLAAWTRGTP